MNTPTNHPLRRLPPAEPQRTTCDAGRPLRSLPIEAGAFSARNAPSCTALNSDSNRVLPTAKPLAPGDRSRAIFTTTRPLTNEQRLDAWQQLQTSGDTGPSDSRCHSRSVIGRAFYYLANLTGLAAWFGAIFAVTYIVGALMGVPEPETREFERVDGSTYERTQQQWEVTP